MKVEEKSWLNEIERRAVVETKSTELANPVYEDITEKLPSPEDIHNGRGGYDQNKFAKWLIDSRDYKFICLTDTDEVLYYDKGVYRPGGDRIIRELVVKVMDGNKITINNANETVFLIKRRVPFDRGNVDANENIVNLINGFYDIGDNTLTDHTPDYKSVRQLDIEYNDKATCPKIDKFLHEIVSDADVRFIYELVGYTLLPNKRFGTAVFFEGDGANGKSVLMEMMQRFVGGDMCSEITPNEMCGDDKFAIADLFGKALNVVDDLGNDIVDGVGSFKSVITGNSVRGQRKYGHAFTFIPNVLCIFGCNEVPTTTDTSEGYFRRMRIVNFPNKFEGDNDNKNLIDEITTREEMSGLFNVAINAIRDVIVRGEFTGNKTVEEKRREYLTKSDNILMFIYDECDISDIDAIVEKDELYNQYVLWARDQHTPVKSLSNMTTAIKYVGARVTRPRDEDGGRVQCYKGIQLRSINRQGGLSINLGQGHGLSDKNEPNQEQSDEKDTLGHTGPLLSDIVTTEVNNKVRVGENSMTKSEKQHTDSENTPVRVGTTAMTQHTKSPTDSDYINLKNFDKEFNEEIANKIRAAISDQPNGSGDVESITKTTRGLARTTVHKYLTVYGGILNVIKDGNEYSISKTDGCGYPPQT